MVPEAEEVAPKRLVGHTVVVDSALGVSRHVQLPEKPNPWAVLLPKMTFVLIISTFTSVILPPVDGVPFAQGEQICFSLPKSRVIPLAEDRADG